MIMPEEIPWPFSRLYDRVVNRVFVKWFVYITEEIKNKGISGTILDIGTGPGRLPIEIVKRLANVRVFGIDISRDMIKIAKRNAAKEGVAERIEFRMGSAYKTGFGDNSVDLVLCTGLIHHLKDPGKALNEIYRILKHGGEVWIYDGRKDATKRELKETVKGLGMEKDLVLPFWIVERIWPYIHIGYKTEVYLSGKVRKALDESRFENYDVKINGAYVKITLRKS